MAIKEVYFVRIYKIFAYTLLNLVKTFVQGEVTADQELVNATRNTQEIHVNFEFYFNI